MGWLNRFFGRNPATDPAAFSQLRPGDQVCSGDEAWKDAGECTLPAHGEPKASLQVYQGPPGADRWARFNAFRILRRTP